MHPRLPPDIVLSLVKRAALALGRNRHEPGTAFSLELNGRATTDVLIWTRAATHESKQHDFNRITEDGAEAVILATGHRHQNWRVLRRLQREEHADWLLEGAAVGKRRIIALEISGVDQGSIANRLAQKLAQAAQLTGVDERWAGGAVFEEPCVALRSTQRRKNGN
jgi:hypothetical protein